MRPLLEAWLASFGLPTWLAPTYATMVGLAGLLGAALVLRRTEREGDDVRGTATTLLLAYVAALFGGQLYELLRAVPAAIAEASVHPFTHAGRAAYGGLVFGTLTAIVHTRHRGGSPGAFLDRVAVVLGLVFLLVRTGCFLAGCDYGTPTESALGVSYPPESVAALAHLEAGWVREGASSITVHPTQLYEGAVALVGSAVALVVYPRRPAHGAAFAAWLVVYAAGRAAIETLRGDVDRGLYSGVSSAQWTSLVLLLGSAGFLAAAWLRGRPLRAEAPRAA